MNGLNDQSIVDVRKIVTGMNGQLFVTSRAGINIFLAEVNTFQSQLSVNVADYQPVGSGLVFGVVTGYSLTLTLTEAVVRDDVMLQELIDDLQNGWVPSYDFQGKLSRRDGESQRIVYRRCTPDGTIDLQNITSGSIVERAWSFRVNHTPELLKYFPDVPAISEGIQFRAS